MSKEYVEHIRNQVGLFKSYLLEKHEIVLTEMKAVNGYGIKYIVEKKDFSDNGVAIIYCDKKYVCKLHFEKNMSSDNRKIIEEVFNNRNELHIIDNENEKGGQCLSKNNLQKLKYIYEALMPYRNEKLDFISFAKELAPDVPVEALDEVRYDFDKLEDMYKRILKEA